MGAILSATNHSNNPVPHPIEVTPEHPHESTADVSNATSASVGHTQLLCSHGAHCQWPCSSCRYPSARLLTLPAFSSSSSL
ncbi:MAG: hypothetical protein Q8P67_00855 [archaeon]|nr:hypothetical protein [archaeon]